MMTKFRDLHTRWMSDPEYRTAYNALEGEFNLAAAIIEARGRAGLTQGELAQLMNTTQSVVARLEGGGRPTTRTLEKIALATGCRLKISFEPNNALHAR